MQVPFSKYQGTGNDFIIIDNRNLQLELSTEQVKQLCDRRFGVGADGLIFLENREGYDFYMKYYNSDGRVSSMCGNGGRCIAAYAKATNIVKEKTTFLAADGPHEALFIESSRSIVKLKMGDVDGHEKIGKDYFLNTGSPHYVKFVQDAMGMDIVNEGRKIRYNERFKDEGTNVNFVQLLNGSLMVRSYERGVEDETLSCGTGVTASALASVIKGIQKSESGVCNVRTMGGALKVYYERQGDRFINVWLEGEAKFVYHGNIEISKEN